MKVKKQTIRTIKKNDGTSQSEGDHMVIGYNHELAEEKWRAYWKVSRTDEAAIQSPKRPYYNLMMFPYPSAEGLHVGNMYAFTGSDIFGRFKRMQGFDVFEPIGLDGFGIHSENYALKVGRHPMDHASVTEKNFYNQLSRIGAMYDWSRTLETYDPKYYRFTQWLFVQMFKHGLAYRGKAQVNWCPSCKTVLADEQVIEGACERCGNKVEKRLLEQWFFRITDYAEKLLSNLDRLDWTEKVRIAQENWIGKKTGINIEYPVVDKNGNVQGSVTCFTTRPDTNYGATFVVIAPEHPLVHIALDFDSRKDKKREGEIRDYIHAAKTKSDQDRIAQGRKKTGVATGLYCVNQLTGRRMPLYVSDFVLMGFGTGAVVGVPGHDRRDFEFASVFSLPVIRVVVAKDGDIRDIASIEQVQEDEGVMVNSEFLNGLNIHEATNKMMDHIEKKGWGKRVVTYHLRDWLISRQRYWGPPIPMIYCEVCAKAGKSWFTSGEAAGVAYAKNRNTKASGYDAGWYPVPEDQLPVVLPRIEDYKPSDDGIAPLAKHKEFFQTTCPGCGGNATRETDVSDTFLDSSWYFLRYPTVSAKSENTFAFDPTVTKKWLPVHMYTGGAEHSVLHLMYSRFITMALNDWGYIDFDEPFSRFFAHGLVIKDGAKMSKSKGNVVNPDEYIARYGADALRMYLMFIGPFSQGGDFRDSAMEGMSRWVGRIWRMSLAVISAHSEVGKENKEISSALNRLIAKVTDDLEKRRYNTAIASMMEFTNTVSDTHVTLTREVLKKFLIILAPFAPYLTEELWSYVLAGTVGQIPQGYQSIHRSGWPEVGVVSDDQVDVTVVVQVNGKLRESIIMDQKESKVEAFVVKKAKVSDKMQKFLTGEVIKTIFIPGKLVNFVVR